MQIARRTNRASALEAESAGNLLQLSDDPWGDLRGSRPDPDQSSKADHRPEDPEQDPATPDRERHAEVQGTTACEDEPSETGACPFRAIRRDCVGACVRVIGENNRLPMAVWRRQARRAGSITG